MWKSKWNLKKKKTESNIKNIPIQIKLCFIWDNNNWKINKEI